MTISIIAALAQNQTIGLNNTLPWHLPKDLKRFKTITTNCVCIYGRKTFESIGKALPNRVNIVVSRNPTFSAAGCQVAYSLEQALRLASESNPKCDVFVCGGEDLFREAIPLVDRMYLTHIHAHINGDAFFPDFANEWTELEEEQQFQNDSDHAFNFSFVTYARK